LAIFIGIAGAFSAWSAGSSRLITTPSPIHYLVFDPTSWWHRQPMGACATIIVVVVPEKLQTIQEYRFLLYALMVIAVLLFRPEGLLPRPVRRYFPGWQP
jgi:ABC-type branched-subunit amino acid transport system permease subunit